MVGLPGSGKSYIASQFIKGSKVFSSDDYREKLFGDINDQTHNQEVFKQLYKDLNEELSKDNRICVLDATNTTLKPRKNIFSNLTEENKKNTDIIAYIVNTPVEECIRRDKARDRSVGKDIIYKFLSSYQQPQLFEGFNDIGISNFGSWALCVKDNRFEILDKMKEFNQLNPHHIYDLLEHCKKLSSFYDENNYIEYIAGLYHDVGKLFTQTIDENGIAHYYNHDSVGTYYLLTHLKDWYLNYAYILNIYDLNEILFYVNYHMKAHKDFRNVKAEQRYRKLFGDERFNSLIEFANNDMKASGTYEKYKEIK